MLSSKTDHLYKCLWKTSPISELGDVWEKRSPVHSDPGVVNVSKRRDCGNRTQSVGGGKRHDGEVCGEVNVNESF